MSVDNRGDIWGKHLENALSRPRKILPIEAKKQINLIMRQIKEIDQEIGLIHEEMQQLNANPIPDETRLELLRKKLETKNTVITNLWQQRENIATQYLGTDEDDEIDD